MDDQLMYLNIHGTEVDGLPLVDVVALLDEYRKLIQYTYFNPENRKEKLASNDITVREWRTGSLSADIFVAGGVVATYATIFGAVMTFLQWQQGRSPRDARNVVILPDADGTYYEGHTLYTAQATAARMKIAWRYFKKMARVVQRSKRPLETSVSIDNVTLRISDANAAILSDPNVETIIEELGALNSTVERVLVHTRSDELSAPEERASAAFSVAAERDSVTVAYEYLVWLLGEVQHFHVDAEAVTAIENQVQELMALRISAGRDSIRVMTSVETISEILLTRARSSSQERYVLKLVSLFSRAFNH